MNQARKKRILLGDSGFTRSELERYCLRYEELLLKGLEENKHTKCRIAKKEEKALLKSLKKYRKNYLLFLYGFRIPYSDNRSEKGPLDLQKPPENGGRVPYSRRSTNVLRNYEFDRNHKT